MVQWHFCWQLSTQENSFYLDRVGVIPCLQANLVKKANDPSNNVSVTASTTLGCTPCNRCSVYNVPKFTFVHNWNETEQKMAALTQTHEIRLLWFGLYTTFAGQSIWHSLPPAPLFPVSKPTLWVKSTTWSIRRHFKFATECMCFVCVHKKHQLFSYTAWIYCIL
jgi:hypothetical protein